MCYVEYNWTACVWSFRIGQNFTAFRDVRSLPTLKEWREFLRACGCKVTRVNGTLYRVEAFKKR